MVGLTWFNHLEKYESQYGKLMNIIQMFETTNQKFIMDQHAAPLPKTHGS